MCTLWPDCREWEVSRNFLEAEAEAEATLQTVQSLITSSALLNIAIEKHWNNVATILLNRLNAPELNADTHSTYFIDCYVSKAHVLGYLWRHPTLSIEQYCFYEHQIETDRSLPEQIFDPLILKGPISESPCALSYLLHLNKDFLKQYINVNNLESWHTALDIVRIQGSPEQLDDFLSQDTVFDIASLNSCLAQYLLMTTTSNDQNITNCP